MNLRLFPSGDGRCPTGAGDRRLLPDPSPPKWAARTTRLSQSNGDYGFLYSLPTAVSSLNTATLFLDTASPPRRGRIMMPRKVVTQPQSRGRAVIVEKVERSYFI